MPRVLLTTEQRRDERLKRSGREMLAAIEAGRTRYNIEKATIAAALQITPSTLSYRLKDPVNRFSVADLITLSESLKMKNEDILEIIRKGVKEV